MTETIMTVRGAVAAKEVGFCLPHEHAFLDLVRVQPTQLLAYDYQLLDYWLVHEEVGQFVKAVAHSPLASAGQPMLVELTNGPLIGRDPRSLLKLAKQLDLHIVMSCGWYREPWFDAEFDRRSVQSLADQLIGEIDDGVEGGIRPGIIGELGTDRDFVSPLEERVLRAAARAHLQTDLTITLHARASRVALQQIEILRDEGTMPHRIIVGHTDTIHDPDYHEELARLGAWVEFDTVRGKTPYLVSRSLRYIAEVKRRGYLNQLLLSGDIGALSQLRAFGGTGYDYLPATFYSELLTAGFTTEELLTLFVDNPRRALLGTKPEGSPQESSS